MQEIKSINPIFDFQAICDTDLGLYRLIKRDYYDKNIFDNNLFDNNDERFIKTMLLCRDKFNPLFIFCKKNIYPDKEIDDLYRQFLNEEYDNILKLSPPTNIMDIATISNSIKNIVNVTVLCKDKKEIEWLNKYNKKLKYIVSDYKDFKLDKYDTIYIKDIYDLLFFDQDTIDMKNIIIPRFLFNLENGSRKIEMPIIEVSNKYYKRNKFITVDPYKDITVPVGEMV